MGLIQAEKRLIFDAQLAGRRDVASIHGKAVPHIHSCLLLSTQCWRAAELLTVTHSSNDRSGSQMRPAVEGQGGRVLQVWASSAIPKGDLSSLHSVQLGKLLHSCLGKGSQCKPSPLHLPGPPLLFLGQPWGPEHNLTVS